jgi:eukaryotic-like serine/threonine-protein kinase
MSRVGIHLGNAGQAKTNAKALDLSTDRDVQYAVGPALALSGDVLGATRVGRIGPGKPVESVELLQMALRYELAVNGLSFNLYLGGLHSAYVRGEALIAAHRYAEAAAEFQKILGHRGIVGPDPIGVLAHLQLGRVFALAGDKTRARAAYGAFLALWNDADPDVPILKSAKAEYNRL